MQYRSNEPELLDDPAIAEEEIALNMVELNTINTWLGGHAVTVAGCDAVLTGVPAKIHIAEIGCGGGDNMKALYNRLKNRSLTVEFTGVDINPFCIRMAHKQFPAAHYFVSDYRLLPDSFQPDVLYSSLFCHHFTDEELIYQLRWMYNHCHLGFFINDLHRHWLAYYSIKALTAVFSRSRLVKNDAPLSVKRGFVRKDWNRLLQQAGIKGATVQWKWAFRWLIMVKKTTL